MKPNISNPSRSEPMNQAPQTIAPDPPGSPATPMADATPDTLRDRFVGWLKNLAIYLGTVAAACAIGIFFLWQIPFLHDLPEWIKSVSDTAPARPAPAPPALVAGGSPVPAPPEPPASAALPESPIAQTGAIVVHAQPPEGSPETPVDAAPPAATAEQSATPAATQADPATAQADPATAQPASAEQVPASTVQQQEIQQLLADARLQMEDRRFTSPPSGNALRSYQRVLELEPANPIATEGIQRITTYYQDIARQSLLEGRTDESLAYINRGLRAAPNNAALLSLRREARSVKQREEQQRQALLEERRRQETEAQTRRQEADQTRELSRQPPPIERPPPWWQRQQQQPPAYNESGFNQR